MLNNSITLTITTEEDLNTFFEFQLNEEANYMAAFTPKNSNDKVAYIKKYTKYMNDPEINMMTIKLNDVIVGSIAKFIQHNEAGITYWTDKKYWGLGIATAALKHLIKIETAMPIHGGVALDNYGSQRVLEKCGFVRTGRDKGFANARQTQIEEYIYKFSK